MSTDDIPTMTAGPLTVCAFLASGEDTVDDGAWVVQIDTDSPAPKRVRVAINDGTVYDRDPETDHDYGDDLSVTRLSDEAALDAIADVIRREEFNADSLEPIVAALAASGRVIGESTHNPDEPLPEES